MFRGLLLAVWLGAGGAWAKGSCEDSCKATVKTCTDECQKRQPKNKHGDCKKACTMTEKPCLDSCKK